MIPLEYRLAVVVLALLAGAFFYAGWAGGIGVATKSYNASLTELQQEHQVALAANRGALREEYRDLAERQACLREELEWAGEYIKLLDSEHIEMALRDCYTEER